MSRAYKDDEVYFHHNGQPKAGKVLCTGRHGCTVEHEGRQHRIKWAHLSGHKSRAPQDYTIEDHGESGVIVKNQHGHRRFIAIPPEARAEQLKLDRRAKKSAASPAYPES